MFCDVLRCFSTFSIFFDFFLIHNLPYVSQLSFHCRQRLSLIIFNFNCVHPRFPYCNELSKISFLFFWKCVKRNFSCHTIDSISGLSFFHCCGSCTLTQIATDNWWMPKIVRCTLVYWKTFQLYNDRKCCLSERGSFGILFVLLIQSSQFALGFQIIYTTNH